MARDTTVEELEALHELLTGPMRPVFEQAGAIIMRKLRERGVTVGDLSHEETGAILYAALIEAVADLFPDRDIASLEEAMGLTFADIAMEMAANADGGDSVN